MTQGPLKSQQILKQTGQTVILYSRQSNSLILVFFNTEHTTKPILSTLQAPEFLFLGQSIRIKFPLICLDFFKKEKGKITQSQADSLCSVLLLGKGDNKIYHCGYTYCLCKKPLGMEGATVIK